MNRKIQVLALLSLCAACATFAHAGTIVVGSSINFDQSEALTPTSVVFYNGGPYAMDVNGPGNFDLTTGETIYFDTITNNPAALAAGEILFNVATGSGNTEFIARSYSYSSYTTPSNVFESFLFMTGTIYVDGDSDDATFSLTDLGGSGSNGYDTGTSVLMANGPEPASLLLLGTGMAALSAVLYRRRSLTV